MVSKLVRKSDNKQVSYQERGKRPSEGTWIKTSRVSDRNEIRKEGGKQASKQAGKQPMKA